MNIMKCALRAGGIGIWKCWFLWREEAGEPGEKPSEQGDENQQQTQPTCDAESGNRIRATLVDHPCSPQNDLL